jgi:hypothetical protein
MRSQLARPHHSAPAARQQRERLRQPPPPPPPIFRLRPSIAPPHPPPPPPTHPHTMPHLWPSSSRPGVSSPAGGAPPSENAAAKSSWAEPSQRPRARACWCSPREQRSKAVRMERQLEMLRWPAGWVRLCVVCVCVSGGGGGLGERGALSEHTVPSCVDASSTPSSPHPEPELPSTLPSPDTHTPQGRSAHPLQCAAPPSAAPRSPAPTPPASRPAGRSCGRSRSLAAAGWKGWGEFCFFWRGGGGVGLQVGVNMGAWCVCVCVCGWVGGWVGGGGGSSHVL